MKRGMVTLMAALSMAALVAGGCASKEVVKSEDQAGATTKSAPAVVEPVKPEPPKVEAPVAETKQAPEPPKQTEESGQAAKASTADVSFETAYFDFDKSDLRQDARDVLKKNAEILLKARTDAKIKIEGHCDERGSAEYNLGLGERRAKSVQQYLLTLGVQPDRLSVISYGKEKPAIDGHDEAAWAKNRRAEFVVEK